MMLIIQAGDYTDMSKKAAAVLASTIVSNPCAVLGLATGDSPIGLYRCLADWYERGIVDFSRTSSVNLDEYLGIKPDAPQSYIKFMNDNLFSKINIRLENAHIMDGLAADPAAECARYDAVIDGLGGIDIQLLGIGNNGHIGFNEPGDAFIKDTHIADLTESTIQANRRFFERAEDVPAKSYTMGIRPIMQARKVLLIASGAHKADILRRALYGDISPSVPASILQLHSDLTVVGDKEALSALPKLPKLPTLPKLPKLPKLS